jgi:hypothetical protein
MDQLVPWMVFLHRRRWECLEGKTSQGIAHCCLLSAVFYIPDAIRPGLDALETI